MATPAQAITSQLVNANANLQAPGTMGGGQPVLGGGGNIGTPGSAGGINSNQQSLNEFIQNFQTQLSQAQQGITSSVDVGNQQIQTAIQGLQSQQQSFDTKQMAGLQGAIQGQANKFGTTLFNTKAGPGGLSTNSVLLQNLQQDNADTIKQLEASASAAMANGDVQFATQISNLQAKQYEMALNAKESIYQNLINEGSAVASLSQAQTAQAQQQEQQMNDMATLATKYGVAIQPGWTMTDVIKAVTPKASMEETLHLGEMRASINASNAQAALATAQASVISPMSQDQIDSLITWYTDQPPGSQMQQQAGQQIGQILANNPKNATLYAQAYNEWAAGHTFDVGPNSADTGTLSTWVGIAKSNGMDANSAISAYVINNPGVKNKTDVANYFYAAYGVQPAVNPFTTAIGALGSRFSVGIMPGQMTTSGGKSVLTPSGKATAEMGAAQFNRNNPQTANMPGANYYVNLVTGNTTTSYNDFLKQQGLPTQ